MHVKLPYALAVDCLKRMSPQAFLRQNFPHIVDDYAVLEGTEEEARAKLFKDYVEPLHPCEVEV